MTRKFTAHVAMLLALSVSWTAQADQLKSPVKEVAPETSAAQTEATSATSAAQTEKLDLTKVVAEFPNGDKIMLGQVVETKEKLPPQLKDLPLEKIYEVILNRLVDMKLVLDAAIKSGIDKDPEIKKRIADAQEALTQKAYLDKEIAKLVTNAILQEKYQELLKMLPKGEMEVRLSHILLKTKKEAEDVLKEIKGGKKFDDLMEKSIDTQTKGNKGDLGFVRKGDLPKDFAESVFKTAKGSLVSEPMAIGNLGFSIVRVDDKRPVEPPKFEEVKADISKAIAPEFAVKVIENLRKEYSVKKTGLDGKPLVEKTPEEKKKEEETKGKDDKPAVDISKIDPAMVVAEFANGDKITFAQLQESVKTLPPQLREVPFHKIFEPLLNRLVDMKIITLALKKDGIDKDPAVLKKLDEARDALIQKAFLDKEIATLITPEMLKEKYQELLKMLPKGEMEIRLRHILVKTKKEADEVIKSLKGGASFDELVKTKSIDEQTKANNGELGYVRKSELPKEFGEAVFKAAKATMLPEPVSLGELGFSIVRVEDKRPVEPPQLEEVKGELLKILSAEQATKVLEKIRKEVPVKKFDMEGKPLVEKTPEGLKDNSKG